VGNNAGKRKIRSRVSSAVRSLASGKRCLAYRCCTARLFRPALFISIIAPWHSRSGDISFAAITRPVSTKITGTYLKSDIHFTSSTYALEEDVQQMLT
jgi:hypothetical protein